MFLLCDRMSIPVGYGLHPALLGRTHADARVQADSAPQMGLPVAKRKGRSKIDPKLS